MMTSIIQIANLFAMYTLYGTVLRFVIFKLTSKGFADGLNNLILNLRSKIIQFTESLWPDRENTEVIFLSRVAVPFVIMLMVEVVITIIMQQLGDYLGLLVIVWFLKLFVMINVAPPLEDWSMLYDANKPGMILVVMKFVILLSLITVNEQRGVNVISFIPNSFLLIALTLIPFTSWKVYT